MAGIRPASVVMVGGFGLVGQPLTLVSAMLGAPGAQGLTIVSNNIGEPGRGLGLLLRKGQVSRVIGSYFTTNPEVLQWRDEGRLEVELMPQGTLAEAIRAGGAGIGGFYVRTGAGTLLAQGREQRELGGEAHLFYEALRADVALIRALKADACGNLVYSRTARNFNPDMATAAKMVIAEVDEIVEVGEISPEQVVTPHIYVDRVVRSTTGAAGR